MPCKKFCKSESWIGLVLPAVGVLSVVRVVARGLLGASGVVVGIGAFWGVLRPAEGVVWLVVVLVVVLVVGVLGTVRWVKAGVGLVRALPLLGLLKKLKPQLNQTGFKFTSTCNVK